MASKIFTPLNIGAFDLKHRIVVEWSGTPDKAVFHVASEPILAGGMMICDLGVQILSAENSKQLHERAFVRPASVKGTRTEQQTILARISASISLSHGVANIRELSTQDIEKMISEFADAARRAKFLGYDGVELNGAIGSATDILLHANTNTRIDRYGGGWEQRINFLMEAVEVLTHVFGRDRTGVRLSPFASCDEIELRDQIYCEVLQSLSDREISYVHLVDCPPHHEKLLGSPVARQLRRAFSGILVASARSFGDATQLIQARWADAVCFSSKTVDRAVLDEIELAKTGAKD
jgi:2,4-dienoyl-CoA reductase-like NADH-dependent reductase (Old Yellow Enzyme family)